MAPLLLVTQPDELDLVPEALARHGGEFCLSPRLDVEMFAAVCRAGYLPMADAAAESAGHRYLLIKCHQRRFILYPEDLHVSRSTRRRVRQGELVLRVNHRFDQVLSHIDAYHQSSWFTPDFCRILRALHREPVDGVSVFCAGVYSGSDRQELLAGEIGYRVGGVYTSLSGFFGPSGSGAVQLAALGRLLGRCGFTFWDLGMEIEYKRALGARGVDRAEFLRRYAAAAAQDPPPPLPPASELLGCAALLAPG